MNDITEALAAAFTEACRVGSITSPVNLARLHELINRGTRIVRDGGGWRLHQ
jgi:hypothetical protein